MMILFISNEEQFQWHALQPTYKEFKARVVAVPISTVSPSTMRGTPETVSAAQPAQPANSK
jgi:hypothetical protein